MKGRDRIEFESYDGSYQIQTGQGDRCVLLQLLPRVPGSPGAGVVLTDSEAEALGRSLIRRARYSRRPA